MTGYGSSFYGSNWYLGSPFRSNTVLYVGIKARIVKPISSIPPVMDSISVGLAERFDWLQMGIQAFGLFNKIEYATGSPEGIRPSLDEVWGQIYDLPRLTGETDDDYRARLKTYVKVLTGSGTVPNSQEVIDHLIGLPGETVISSVWPAQARINFRTVTGMRAAKAHLTLLNSVLPGMFAAGVDYSLHTPFQDVGISAHISGDATLDHLLRAAIAADQEASCGIDALIAYGREELCSIIAAVAKEWTRYIRTFAAIRAERGLPHSLYAAIQGEPVLPLGLLAAIQTEPDLPISYYAAIQGEPELPISYYAAVARNFEMRCGILARVVYMYELASKIKAAVSASQEMSVGIRARIARSA